jgi:hypothetical protein
VSSPACDRSCSPLTGTVAWRASWRRRVVVGAAAWAVMAGTYVPMLRYYRQPRWLSPLLPFTAFLYLLMTVDSAVQHYRGRGAAWKGRTYARPDAMTDEG